MGKKKVCTNCLYYETCEKVKEVCEEHCTVAAKRGEWGFTVKAWHEFAGEWDRARGLVRKYI